MHQEVQGAGGGVAEGGDAVWLRTAARRGRDEAGQGLQVMIMTL